MKNYHDDKHKLGKKICNVTEKQELEALQSSVSPF